MGAALEIQSARLTRGAQPIAEGHVGIDVRLHDDVGILGLRLAGERIARDRLLVAGLRNVVTV